MAAVKFTLAFWLMRFCDGVEYVYRNISCSGIKTMQGFKFLHECANGAEVRAHFNETPIASFKNGKPELMPALVKSIDNASITTVDCRDLRVQCSTFAEYMREKWTIFTVTALTEDIKEPVPDPPTPDGLWIGVGVGVGAVIILGILGFCSYRYRCWRNDMMKQHRPATVLAFLETTFCGKRKSNEPAELGYVTVAAANDPQGSGENGPVQNGAAVVHSGDTNGHDSRATTRVEKDDPGGFNCVMVTDACSGCVRGDCGAEDHETESSLLRNEGVNIQDPDMAGGAEASVNNSSFDPGRVGGCAAPNSDVESPQDEETQNT